MVARRPGFRREEASIVAVSVDHDERGYLMNVL
jgi:hypothetical protein